MGSEQQFVLFVTKMPQTICVVGLQGGRGFDDLKALVPDLLLRAPVLDVTQVDTRSMQCAVLKAPGAPGQGPGGGPPPGAGPEGGGGQ